MSFSKPLIDDLKSKNLKILVNSHYELEKDADGVPRDFESVKCSNVTISVMDLDLYQTVLIYKLNSNKHVTICYNRNVARKPIRDYLRGLGYTRMKFSDIGEVLGKSV